MKRSLRFVGAVLMTALLVQNTLVAPSAYATVPGQNGGILTNQNGWLELVDPSTGYSSPVAGGGGSAQQIGEYAIAADGDTMAYVLDYDDNFDGTYDRTVLRVQSIAEGSLNYEIPFDGYHLSFSPDGSMIAFNSWGDNAGLEILDLYDGSIARIFNGDNYMPEWSPDGTKIAYYANSNIYYLDLTTGNPTQLTSDNQGGYITDWSPDGTKIALSRNQKIYFLNVSTRVLTDFDPTNVYTGQYLSNAAFSPDGTMLTISISGWPSSMRIVNGLSSTSPTTTPSTSDYRYGVEWQTLGNTTSSTPIPQTNRQTIYRFYSPVIKHHLYTSDQNEVNYIRTNMSGVWNYEGPVFKVRAISNCDANKNVYRFYSEALKTHLFTMDENEKATLIGYNRPDIWRYEGIAYCADKEQMSIGEVPIYRFYSPLLKSHLFTLDENEKNTLIGYNRPDVWQYEGIAYYAYQ